MALVDSKKYWTKPLIAFAVMQFVFSMIVWWVWYKNTPTFNPVIWRIGFLIGLFTSLTTSILPAAMRNRCDDIRLGGKTNFAYFSVLVPFIVFFLYKAFISYYHWDFSFKKSDIGIFSNLYVTCSFFSACAISWFQENISA